MAVLLFGDSEYGGRYRGVPQSPSGRMRVHLDWLLQLRSGTSTGWTHHGSLLCRLCSRASRLCSYSQSRVGMVSEMPYTILVAHTILSIEHARPLMLLLLIARPASHRHLVFRPGQIASKYRTSVSTTTNGALQSQKRVHHVPQGNSLMINAGYKKTSWIELLYQVV